MRDPVTVNRANRHRGEVEAVIDGERRILCLTLGALAELECAFGAESLADLGARFSGNRLKSADLIRILACGLRGGGNRLSDDDVADMAVEGGLAGAARLVGELLAVTFADGAVAGPGHGAGPGSGSGSGQRSGQSPTPKSGQGATASP